MNSLVVMGVSGCGKSRVGSLIAEGLKLPLIEGDEFHSAANRALMRQGIPLTDEDRAGWLDRLGAELALHPGGAVLTCSALKLSYRDRLRAASPGLRFAWLDLSAEDAQVRVSQRSEHFFPAALVESQFEALEPPSNEAGVLRVDAMAAPESIARRVMRWMDDGESQATGATGE